MCVGESVGVSLPTELMLLFSSQGLHSHVLLPITIILQSKLLYVGEVGRV